MQDFLPITWCRYPKKDSPIGKEFKDKFLFEKGKCTYFKRTKFTYFKDKSGEFLTGDSPLGREDPYYVNNVMVLPLVKTLLISLKAGGVPDNSTCLYPCQSAYLRKYWSSLFTRLAIFTPPPPPPPTLTYSNNTKNEQPQIDTIRCSHDELFILQQFTSRTWMVKPDI